jgi:hypothetical protein
MPRSNSTTETLVPISAIAMRLGWLDEQVANRVKASDIHADWNGDPAVPWSAAKATLEMLAAEKAAYEREQYAAMNAQMDEEQFAREYPLRAFEDAQRQNVIGGVQMTVPPASETEEWAE